MGRYDRTPWRRVAFGFTGILTAGTLAYGFNSTRKVIVAAPTPPQKLQRDDSGRIRPPTFPAVDNRAKQLADLRRSGDPSSADQYDLLIIGGGATGAGIALDAVTRGLKVALVERDDFSAGTSSKSTKLVHGGVRYLEKAVWNLDMSQLRLVMEALHERKTFLSVAPHLSASLPILLPLQHWWQAPYMWLGTKAYDLLAGSEGLESSYFVSRNRALQMLPMLGKDNLVGALVYYDGQHNDSRMNVSLALTAALYGATVLNHVEVTGLEKTDKGRICGVKARDVLAAGHGTEVAGAHEFSIRARGVINATGPFTDAIERMDEPSRKPLVAPASGSHIMLDGNLCPNGVGLLDASTSDGRVIFVLPWQGQTLAGTTDNACDVERHPVSSQADIDFILKEVNKLLAPGSAFSRADVRASWSGIRPLIRDPKAKNTESLVRSHLVTVSPSGLLTCAGGKWTTYRQMAEDAVDEAITTFQLTPSAAPVDLADVSGQGLAGLRTNGSCRTRTTRLAGAHGFSRTLPAELVLAYGIDLDVAQHLASNYGDRAWAVLSDKKPLATARLSPQLPFIEAEVRYGIRAELACTAADVISRRTRLAFVNAAGALKALPRVIDIMADEQGWDPARKQREWTETVQFLGSMGLPAEMLKATRSQVCSGDVTTTQDENSGAAATIGRIPESNPGRPLAGVGDMVPA